MNVSKSIKVTGLSLALLLLPRFVCFAHDVGKEIEASFGPNVKTSAARAKASSGASLASLTKTNDAWVVLQNPLVKQSMITVMGNKLSLFNERTQTLNQPGKLGDELYSHGGVKGLYTIQESAFSFNMKTHSMQVALLDDGKLNIWGCANQSALSQPMKDYIADLQSRSEDTPVQLLFEAPNQSTISSVETPKSVKRKSSAPKHLNLSSPTGIYEREGEEDGATLKVLQLAADQIKFDLFAAFNSNTGEASGIVQMTNNQGVYQGDNYQLVFVFRGNSFNLEQTGDGPFGGMNVRPDGTYNKTSGDTPTIPE